MDGDTGVLLPPGLSYPEHWPVWDPTDEMIFDKASDEAPTRLDDGSAFENPKPFVFLSYAKEDRETVDTIRRHLVSEGLECWWDQEIAPGDGWRETIKEKHKSSAVVLTSWTQHSCASDSVREEASYAQKARKLVHCRLDRTDLPFGFAETQYQDLTDWNSSAEHPGFRRVVQAVWDKLCAPNGRALEERLSFNSKVSAFEQNGKISAKDSPPDVDPPLHHPEHLEQQLIAQKVLADKICRQLGGGDFPNNLDRTVLVSVEHYGDWVIARPACWQILANAESSMRTCLEKFADEPWPVTTKSDVELLCENNKKLKPYLLPPQPSRSADAPAEPPDINPDHTTGPALKQVIDDTETVLSDPDTERVLDNSAKNALTYFKEGIAAGAAQEISGERSERSRYRWLRIGILGLAGFISTIFAGVTVNTLTAPAAAQTLFASLRAILDKLLAFF